MEPWSGPRSLPACDSRSINCSAGGYGNRPTTDFRFTTTSSGTTAARSFARNEQKRRNEWRTHVREVREKFARTALRELRQKFYVEWVCLPPVLLLKKKRIRQFTTTAFCASGSCIPSASGRMPRGGRGRNARRVSR